MRPAQVGLLSGLLDAAIMLGHLGRPLTVAELDAVSARLQPEPKPTGALPTGGVHVVVNECGARRNDLGYRAWIMLRHHAALATSIMVGQH